MQAILSRTPQRDWRQLAIIDAAGRTACFFGRKVLAAKAEVEGLDCAAIANVVRAAKVPRAMTAALADLRHADRASLELARSGPGRRRAVK